MSQKPISNLQEFHNHHRLFTRDYYALSGLGPSACKYLVKNVIYLILSFLIHPY